MRFSANKLLRREWFCVLILAVVSFAVLSPVMFRGLPYGWDLPHHYQCVTTFVESIRAGDFYPSWSLNRNMGYGGMETRLYPPVSHYTLALAYLATGDWQAATWLTLFLFTFAGALGVYLWAREYTSPAQAAFAGSVFAVLPYHLNQIYNTFFYAEYIGNAVLPFTFVFIHRVCRRGKLIDVLGLGISFAALVLTHLPLTVIGSMCFAIYGVSLLKRENIVRQLAGLASGAALGLAASSFFWIKVIQERELLAKTLNYPDPWLDYRLHFLVTPLQTFTDPLAIRIYENSTFFYDLMLLCVVVLAAAFTLPFLRTSFGRFRRIKGVVAIFALAVFLTTPFSRPIWDHFSLLQEVQFPWRWLAIACITAPVVAAAGLKPLVHWYSSDRRPLAFIITGCLLAVVTFSAFQIVRPAPIVAKAEFDTMMEENAHKEGFTFWWTIWTKREAMEIQEKVLAGGRNVEIQTWEATEKKFDIDAGEAATARVAVFYHPNWKALVDGTPVETAPDENGALTFPVPAKRVSVKLEFRETTASAAARKFSAAVWLLILLCLPLALFWRQFRTTFTSRDLA